jgi:two-component system chemotaxis sensor kinase CheA
MKTDLHEQLIKDLLIESFEGLDSFDRDLLALEAGTGGPDILNRMFRVIHTIKGTAGCLGLQKIERVAHVGENLLSLVREHKLTVTRAIISALLRYADVLREMLHLLETTRSEGDRDYSEVLQLLRDLQTPEAAAPAEAAPAEIAPVEMAPVGAPVVLDEEVAAENGWGLFDDSAPTPTPTPTPTPAVPLSVTPAPAVPAAAVVAAVKALPKVSVPSAPVPVADAGAKTSVAETAIRVDVAQLDRLMNLVGELVLARNQIAQHLVTSRDAGLQAVAQRLNHITSELQEGVMKTRMQAIDSVLTRFPRIVRDVANELGKQVRLEMAGRETELDRTIIEAIKDPLTHVVRNSIDHGIEMPDLRTQAGKSPTGLLFIRAYHEGGQVNIEIADDGAGINPERVKQKALEKGLITPDMAARLSDREAVSLIFLPGLSTAAKVTNVSGRGVGMDVVKTNVERIGGSVDIHSELGQGTTIKFKIPLTLAIIPALIITSGGERFAIPQVSLLELVRIEGPDGKNGIETVFNAPVFRLRGKLLPLVYLNRTLELGGTSEMTSADDVRNLVVLQADGRQFGMVVDAVNDTQEIVVKPLGKQLKGLTCFAGATIMGDGCVALILDVLGIGQHAAVLAENRAGTNTSTAAAETTDEGNRQTLLVFDAGENSRFAMPLSEAARLEEFPRGKIERSGRREAVQYRGAILPLIDVANQLGRGPGIVSPDVLQVVVYSDQGRSVGLVVDRIIDIVEEKVVVERHGLEEGILGSALVQGQVTDLLDVRGVIRRAAPAFFTVAPSL